MIRSSTGCRCLAGHANLTNVTDQDSPLRLLVVSDLHAHDGNPGDQAPSKLGMKGAASDAEKVFQEVPTALTKAGVDSVDYVLCAGDITNRAEAGPLALAWRQLTVLATQLSAKLIATAGNHDYASHEPASDAQRDDLPDEVDPKDALLQLDPPFPTGADAERQRYFSYSFAVDDAGPALVVSLNSCTYHGLTTEMAPEYDHGRVTPNTVNGLMKGLSQYHSDARPRILLTHHHPIQLPHVDLKERSAIKDAGLLLSALERTGPWLIIHGHKHRPWIQYSHGGGDAPVIISAASFSANLGGGKFGSHLTNQFHLVELPTQSSGSLETPLAGTVRSWSLDLLAEPIWYEANLKQGLMGKAGFGWRASPSLLADRLRQQMLTEPGTIGPQSLQDWEPRLQYLIPADLERVYEIIEATGEIEIERTSTGAFSGVRFLNSEEK